MMIVSLLINYYLLFLPKRIKQIIARIKINHTLLTYQSANIFNFLSMNQQQKLNPVKKLSESRPNHHLLEFKNEFLNPNSKSQQTQILGEVRHRNNVIKINKAKLPADFFPKCWSFEKKLPHFKTNLNPHERLMPTERRKVQSERLHNSPEKSSLFGLFQPDPFKPAQFSSKTLAVKRKFQTRQETKRDNSEVKRRFTPGSNLHRNEMLDIFPSAYDNDEMMVSISSKKMQRMSPRKQYHLKCQQMVHDPQKYDEQRLFNYVGNKQPSTLINLRSIEKTKQDDNKEIQTNSYVYTDIIDLHNMTFFNAKSSCLPPIRKAG